MLLPLQNALGPIGHRPIGLPFGLLRGLVSWWDLDEESGVRADAVGSNDLTDVNNVLYGDGKIGNAALFAVAGGTRLEGTIQFTPNPSTGWTQGGWVYPTSTGVNQGLICLGNSASRLLRLADARAYFALTAQSAILATIPQDEWSFVLGWYDPADDKTHVQINEAVNELAGTAINEPDFALDVILGSQIGTTSVLNGKLDLMGIWSRVLTSDERTKLFNFGASIKHPFTDNGEGFRQGLVHRWSLDEESGTRADSIGGADLTENGTVTYAAGKNGNAAHWDRPKSTSNFLASAVTWAPNPATGFTFAIWVKPDGAADSGEGLIVLPGEFRLTRLADERSYWYNYNTSAGVRAIAGGDILQDQWSLVVAWYDPATDQHHVQVNGGTVANSAVGTPTNSAAIFNLGNQPGTYPFAGELDEPMVWDRTLTVAERAALYAAGAGRFYDFNTL